MLKKNRLLLFLCLIYCQNTVQASKDIRQAGDVLQILIPATAYASTLYLNDKEGQIQFYKSFAANFLITNGLKNTVAKRRPNGGVHSFPSGHTSAAFQGAAFIHKRYGINYAIAPYIAATFVGYSRVESDYHYNFDVMVGAAIGIITSFNFTTGYNDFRIRPVLRHKQIGLEISMQL